MEHAVRLPSEFIDYVPGDGAELMEAEVDHYGWNWLCPSADPTS
jgi:hypothetical protein